MKRRILFFIFCSFAIILLVATLVLVAHFQKNSKNNGNNPPKDNSKVYATSLTLLCPREIVIEQGKSVELDTNFIKLEPYNTTEKVNFEITTRSEKPIGINFENNIINALDVGFYYVKFYISSGETSIVHDTLVVHVVENTGIITQNIQTAVINESLNFNETFTISSGFQVKHVLLNGNACTNNKFMFTSLGLQNIEIYLYSNKITYK